MAHHTRPQRVFWNRVGLIVGIPLVTLLILATPRSTTWRSVGGAPLGNGESKIGMFSPVVVTWQAPAFASPWDASATSRRYTINWLGVAGSVGLLGSAIFSMVWAARWDVRRRKLQGACDECGQDLKGLRGSTCPECGTVTA
jgi:hypothetical protein